MSTLITGNQSGNTTTLGVRQGVMANVKPQMRGTCQEHPAGEGTGSGSFFLES